MSEERLQEIKDSVKFQYTLAKAKGYDNALLFTNEEEELIEEVERLKKREQECIDHYLVQCKYASEMEDKYITTNNIINEIYTKANDTNITSLDLRDYILNNLGVDKK